MVSRANVQSDRKGEVVRMTGHEQDASIQRDDSHVRFRGSLVRGQNPISRGMLVGFAQCLVLMLSLVLAGTSAMAQATTGISGVVQDASGAVVPNASIVATDTDTNFTAKAVSGPDGGFVLTSLPVGPYSLAVTATGFKPYTQTGIILSIAQVFNVQVETRGRLGDAAGHGSSRLGNGASQ